MPLDPAMTEALKQASEEVGQSNAFSKRLHAWFTHLSDEEVSRETNAQFYAQVCGELKVDGVNNAD